MYDLVIFDLDGTLTDSKPGIVRGIQYAFSKLDMPPPEAELIQSTIGGPFRPTLRSRYGMDDETIARFVDYYREYYHDRGIFENSVYPGIKELLGRLSHRQRRMAVATAKPAGLAELVLTNFGLRRYFELVVGSGPADDVPLKADILRTLLAQWETVGDLRGVMIGDRSYDVQGARANGLDSIAVSYGYATPDEIREASPTYVADSVEALGLLLLGPAEE